ncbi:MAG: metal-dependent transcriptional regulator [Chloroflexota bacterium]
MNRTTEEYLEALYTLTQDGKAAGTSELSRRLKVTPASVTEMLKKLADAGLADYSSYQGATLTPEGFRIGEKMARRHRLLERFLHNVLKVGKDKVHPQACEMEHGLSDETERAFCAMLKQPARCPDDEKIIPPCDLQFSSCDECQEWNGKNLEEVGKRRANLVSITALKERQEGTVAFIRGDSKVLRRLLDIGLTPGTRISVTRVAPLKGPVEIAVRGSRLALGEEIASNVFIDGGTGG